MRADGSRQIHEDVELLHLARARHGEEARDREFAVGAPIAEHDLAPLHRRSKGALGGIVGGLHALMMHKDKELLMMREQGDRQVPDVAARAVQMPLAQGKELSLQREPLADQLRARERAAARGRVTAEPIPQAKQARMQRQRVTTEARGLGRFGELLCAQQNCSAP